MKFLATSSTPRRADPVVILHSKRVYLISAAENENGTVLHTVAMMKVLLDSFLANWFIKPVNCVGKF